MIPWMCSNATVRGDDGGLGYTDIKHIVSEPELGGERKGGLGGIVLLIKSTSHVPTFISFQLGRLRVCFIARS